MEATTPLFLRGNALHLPLPDASVDLVVTSPPYFGLRDYGAGEHEIGSEATPAEFLDALVAATREMVRVLKPSGSIWVNLGDKFGGKSLLGLPWRYAIRCVDELGLVLREEVIWAKPNGLPESVRDRCARKHEQWFHFTVSPRYFAAVDLLREEYGTNRKCPGGGNTYRAMRKAGAKDTNLGGAGYHALGKLPGSVWTVATEPLRVPEELGVQHFAAFPSEWPRRIVLGWAPTRGICTVCGEGLRPVTASHRQKSRPAGHAPSDKVQVQSGGKAKTGDREAATTTITGWACACDTPGPTEPAVVLDPFSGTGTTAIVASALGCQGVGVDLNPDYIRLAQWRATDGRLADKVVERTTGKAPAKRRKAAPAADDQPTLF